MKIIIIGAGVAGLAASIRLAARGHEVVVYEAASGPGGKLSEIRFDGFRFDAGPSLFTMPHLVDDLFRLAGKIPQDHFSYERLDTICHYFWEDGARLEAPADQKDFCHIAASTFNIPPQYIEKALSDSRRKYELTARVFLEQSLHKIRNYWSKDVLKALLQIHKLDIFRSLHTVNKNQLKEPHLVQLFDRYATYNGSDPYKTPGIMASIPHLEYGIGAFFPKGGMYAITKAMFTLASDVGVTFHFDKKVEQILVEKRKAKGVKVGGKSIKADNVVSNMDVYFTYRNLLTDQHQPEKILRQEKSSSALIFYWGIKRKFSELGLHNIFFTQDYAAEFDCLTRTKTLYHDPTVYINITSKAERSDAPDGCENWFTMINVPHDNGQNWPDLIKNAKRSVIKKLSRILGRNIEPLIIGEALLDPLSLQEKTSSYLGALYGTSSNSRYAAFLRHPNFSNQIKGLYFCGGSVHPGGGIPLCLLSAKIVDEEMAKSD